jgi:hypothetical protein
MYRVGGWLQMLRGALRGALLCELNDATLEAYLQRVFWAHALCAMETRLCI